MTRLRTAWYWFVRGLVRHTFFRAVGGLKTVGLENVPRQGAVIVAPVHFSHTDPPAVACTINRRLGFLAKEELFKVPIFGPIIRSVGAFPIRRGEGDTEAIRLSLKLLEQGEAVIVFPEGTRGDGVTMGPINRGVTMLAKRSGAMVLPVGIVGTHKVLPRGASRPKRHRITVAYGKPFRYEDCGDRDKFAVALQTRILSLCAENGLALRTAPSSISREASRSSESPT